jgi:hypothetical protein
LKVCHEELSGQKGQKRLKIERREVKKRSKAEKAKYRSCSFGNIFNALLAVEIPRTASADFLVRLCHCLSLLLRL